MTYLAFWLFGMVTGFFIILPLTRPTTHMPKHTLKPSFQSIAYRPISPASCEFHDNTGLLGFEHFFLEIFKSEIQKNGIPKSEEEQIIMINSAIALTETIIQKLDNY